MLIASDVEKLSWRVEKLERKLEMQSESFGTVWSHIDEILKELEVFKVENLELKRLLFEVSHSEERNKATESLWIPVIQKYSDMILGRGSLEFESK